MKNKVMAISIIIILTALVIVGLAYLSLKSTGQDKIFQKKLVDRHSKLSDIVLEEDKVNLYFFWGDGCQHCEAEFQYLDSIKEEYEQRLNIYAFEVWYNEENAEILNTFTSILGKKVSGVPLTIVGDETYVGFGETMQVELEEAIIRQSKNDYDVYKEYKNR